jgi:hypothetical protein
MLMHPKTLHIKNGVITFDRPRVSGESFVLQVDEDETPTIIWGKNDIECFQWDEANEQWIPADVGGTPNDRND